MLKLAANSNVSVTENTEEEYYMVSMADDAYEPEHYIIFQRSFEAAEQDIELSLTGCYLEVDSQEYAGYGVCEQIVLSRNELTINISEKSKIMYSYANQIVISFSIPEAELSDLVRMMKILFQNNMAVLEINNL